MSQNLHTKFPKCKKNLTNTMKTRVILPGEKALIVDRFNLKIIYVPYTNKHNSQIGEFGTQLPVAVA